MTDNRFPHQTSPGDRPVPALDPLAPTAARPPRQLPGWRLWVPLLLQSMLIVAVPIQDAYTLATGQTVILQTAPVDPYDMLRGYYQTLGYDISSVQNLAKLPGGELLKDTFVGDVYVILAAPTTQTTTPPQAWKPIKVSRDRPTNLPSDQIAIKGKSQGWRVVYGLETYYMPEDQREQVNQAISQIQQRDQRAFVVETKIDQNGNAVPMSLWVRDRNYRF